MRKIDQNSISTFLEMNGVGFPNYINSNGQLESDQTPNGLHRSLSNFKKNFSDSMLFFGIVRTRGI